ncbi:MAG TPA: hypothetical protein VI688_02595 [Anaerolineales bacterium]|nr:hypothetical protein [Anaerolineales bacterium]
MNPAQVKHTAFGALLAAALALAIFAGPGLAATANLVKNGSFEKDTNGDGIPNSWDPVGLSPADKRVCNQSYAGTCSLRMIEDGIYKYLTQNIAVSGGPAENYTLTIWAKGKAIVEGSGHAYIYLIIDHVDGSDNFDFVTLNPGTTPWTKYAIHLASTETYEAIRVSTTFDLDSGKAWFDKVKLVGP